MKWRVACWVLVHALVLAHVAHWKVAGRTLSAVEPSEAGETLELGYVNAGFLLFVALVLATLVLGRFFCGWACHVVAYQDACAWLLGKLGLRPRPIRSRLLVLVPFYAALSMFVLPTVARLLAGHGFPELAVRLTTDDLWARFPGPWIAALTFAVDGALIVWLLGAKGFCTYACPYGAVFGVAERLAPGRIRVTDACEGCGHCTAVCTSNVRVHEEVARFRMVVDPGCMKCMDCVSVCPKDALYFGFAPARGTQPVRGRSRRQYDFTWPEELALAAVFAASLWVWRGLYGAIPFLLALGLSVVAAFASVALWRLAARHELVLQHHVLRAGGRLTGKGAGAFLGLGALLALTAHGGIVRWRDGRAEEALELARATSIEARSSPEREAVLAERRARLLDDAEAHLAWIRRFGLVATADLFNKLGSIRYARGDLDGAERELRAALERDGSFRSSRLLLADVLARRGDFERALDELAALLGVDPGNADAATRLAALLRAVPSNARARDLLALLREGIPSTGEADAAK